MLLLRGVARTWHLHLGKMLCFLGLHDWRVPQHGNYYCCRENCDGFIGVNPTAAVKWMRKHDKEREQYVEQR